MADILGAISDAIEDDCFLHLDGDALTVLIPLLDERSIEVPFHLGEILANQLAVCDDEDCLDRVIKTRDALKSALVAYDNHINGYLTASGEASR